jgi:hypothetical protein
LNTDLTPTAAAAVRPDEQLAAAMANGLRELARLVEDNPRIAPYLRFALRHMHSPLLPAEAPRTAIAELARAAARAGARVEKTFGDAYAGITIGFGPVQVLINADRGDVCERVVVGVDEVTREVPDPNLLATVPKIRVTETVERVKWRCNPLLADATEGGGA